MIYDHLSRAQTYSALSPRLQAAFAYLQHTDFSRVETGRYEIVGSDVYALVQRYQTKPKSEGVWEAHRQYLDVQYVVDGLELMGYTDRDLLKAGEYAEAKDLILFEGAGEFLPLRAGYFVVLWPQDAHMPGIAAGLSAPVLKVVMKVRV